MEHIKRLETILADLENSSGKLADVPVLVKEIRELVAIYKEGNELVEKTRINLDAAEKELMHRLGDLERTLKLERETKEELMNNIRSTLTANNKEQLDAVNSITTVVNNKIAVAESNLNVTITDIRADIRQVDLKAVDNGGKIDSAIEKINKADEKVSTYGDKTSADLGEIKLVIPIVKRTQIIAIVAAVLSLTACILSVVL